MMLWMCGAVVAFAVVLGGGTHTGFLGDVIAQLLAVPLLTGALWWGFESGQVDKKTKRNLLLFASGSIFLILAQLVPLPFGGYIVARLLGHEGADVFPEKVWAPLSVSPQATYAAALSLLVPVAIFLSVIQCNLRQRLVLTWLLLAIGLVALLLGFLQVAEGSSSGLRFYEVTNQTEAVGFFANRNHFATQLCVTLILGGFWLAIAVDKVSRSRFTTTLQALRLTTASLSLVAIVAGLAMTRSRAGIFLGILALAGILCLVIRTTTQKKRRRAGRFGPRNIAIVSVVFAALFAAQFGFGSMLSRFSGDPLDDLRVPLARTTFELAVRSLPFGVGLGSFVPVYATAEKDRDVLDVYANRAHNDFAEFLLETGAPGALLLLVFLIWFCANSYRVWLSIESSEDSRQLRLQRAATLIIALLLVHSLVDYPLRTTALSAIFAFFCAILAAKVRPGATSIRAPVIFLEPERSEQIMPVEKWGSDLNWPRGWHKDEC